MYQFEKFTKFAAALIVYMSFMNISKTRKKSNSDLGNIQIIKDNYLGFRNLTLYTPNYEKILFEKFLSRTAAR
ncbi:hypothetical protein FLX35_09820 [Cylindrospermopsis raciborskii LB2897]|nr:hypothetical protein [Cylindrospermopsis raciborskii LB2897]